MSPKTLQAGRLRKELDRLYRFDGEALTLAAWLANQRTNGPLDLTTCSGTIGWNRRHFNQLDHAGQRAYEARLAAKTHYFVNNVEVRKIIFDALTLEEI